MYVISNAMMNQAEVVQLDRWEYGPLELVFFDASRFSGQEGRMSTEVAMAVVEWNRHHRGGFVRPEEAVEVIERHLPGVLRMTNPNVFLVPRINGYTELHAMLSSVLPDAILRRRGIGKIKATFWLYPFIDLDVRTAAYAAATEAAFRDFIWPRLARKNRLKRLHFALDSSLRLLAGDVGFWMNRLYRVAVERCEFFKETRDDRWDSLARIEASVREELAPAEEGRFIVRRPLMGGPLWDRDDPGECEAVVDEVLEGGGVMESLYPVLEVLHSHRTHEDFSDRYSWVKEDFERSFYSKRSKVRVSLVETVDELPAWEASAPEGYGRVLFRDLMCFFEPRDRHIILALRHGKTVSEIARESGLRGHASVSRRVKRIKAKLRQLLERT